MTSGPRVRFIGAVRVFLAAALGAGGTKQAAAAAVLPEPGQVFFLEFPELGATWAGAPSRMGVHIPSDYTPDRRFPLIVWFGGGQGSDSPAHAAMLSGGRGFICAAVPYRATVGSRNGGWAATPWRYYSAMLRRLEKRVPNIDPGNRVCAGFSSGGSAILALIARSPEFRQAFAGFMPGGAGWNMGGLPALRGRPMLAFMGDRDSRYRGYLQLEQAAREAGVDFTFMVFKDVGHTIPPEYYPKMRTWIVDRVIRRELPDLHARMRGAVRAGDAAAAHAAAGRILELDAPGTARYAEALRVRREAESTGRSQAEKLLAENAPWQECLASVRAWRDSHVVSKLKDHCDDVARAQLQEILDHREVSAEDLRRFRLTWHDFAIRGLADEAYDELAATAYGRVVQIRKPASRALQVRNFMTEWGDCGLADRARAELEQLAHREFDAIMKEGDAGSRGPRLQTFLRRYDGTVASLDARARLEKQ